VLDRSLEIAEELRGVEGADADRRLICTYYGERILKVAYISSILVQN